MAKFVYRVQDGSGKIVEGVLEAPSENHAQTFLAKNQYQILSVKKQGQGLLLASLAARLVAPFESVRPTDFNFFIRQLATLLKAGVPMLTCLQSLQEEMHDQVLKRAVGDIERNVEQGNSFSNSIARHPRIFNALFISTVKAGEAIGELDIVLARLADILEKDYQTRAKIASALRYPQIVIVVMAIAFLIATLFIIPRFKSLFDLFGSQLPLPTRMLVFVSEGFIRYWYLILIVIVALAAGVGFHYRTHAGRRFWDGLILRLWVLGIFLKNAIFSRFSRMLGIMLKSGVNVLEGLELVAQIVGNSIISDAILRIKQQVSQGETISAQMKREGIFPSLLIQMVFAGETSGRMDELLMQIAEHYDAEVDLMTKNIETMIEPIFVILLGFFIALMALGIFLPMWNLYGVIAEKAG